MKKVRISLLVVCVFALFTCTICAASSYEVNSVPRLKKEIKEAYRDGKMSEKEKSNHCRDQSCCFDEIR